MMDFQPGLALFILVSPSNKYHLLLQTLVSCLSSLLGCELTRTEELMAFFPLRYLLSSKKRPGYQCLNRSLLDERMGPGCGEWRVEAVDAEKYTTQKMIDRTKVEASVDGSWVPQVSKDS